MPPTSPDLRLHPIRSLPLRTPLRVWQRRGDPIRSSFFFAWDGPRPTRRAVEPAPAGAIDFEAPGARRLRSSLRRSERLVRRLAHEEEADLDLDDAILSVRSTALYDRSRRESDPGRYADPFEVPYLTLSTRRLFAPTGVDLGDLATVWNLATGRYAHAIVGDGRDVAAVEASPYLGEALGLGPGVAAVYLIHPKSGRGQGSIPSNAEIARLGESLFRRLPGGSAPTWEAILAEFAARWRDRRA